MNGCILALALSGLLHVCVSASGVGIAETASVQAPDLPGDGADDDTRNYIGLNENALTDNDLAPPPSGSGSGHPTFGDLSDDGLTRGLYRWTTTNGGRNWLPGLRISPELVEGLRSAVEAENAMIELHNSNKDSKDDLFDSPPASDWLSRLSETGEGFDPARYLPKRAPTGFTGMRGRRIPSGFNGMRGKKSLPLWSWNNQALQNNPKTYRDGKRAPSGFLGMRGKKSIDTSPDEQWSVDGLSATRGAAKEYPNFLVLDPAFGPSLHVNPAPLKRVPNGFMGLRGKKDCC